MGAAHPFDAADRGGERTVRGSHGAHSTQNPRNLGWADGDGVRIIACMNTLHIQVPINDVAAWKKGFAEHADMRRKAGVRSERVRHPIGDESTLVIDLDFDSVPEAETFLGHLKENVWKDQPILAGTPEATILEPLALG